MCINRIFSIKKTLKYDYYYLFGIKIIGHRRKRKLNLNLKDLRAYTMASHFHKNLEKYRGIYQDKSVVIVGGGPSLKYFEDIDNTIKIGINRAYMLQNIDFDYLFAQDDFPQQKDTDGFINYKPDSCIKFCGIHTNNIVRERISPYTIAQIKNREFYVLNNRKPEKSLMTVNIASEPFMYFNGTVFAALQFALFTSAKKIYLAGFDCTDGIGHAFTQNKESYDCYYQLKQFSMFKEYKEMYWKHTEIISVNPVTLKGMFKDVYTPKYAAEHPEIEEAQILKI